MTDNPEAFPAPNSEQFARDGQKGMTLRDWFAAQALAALCASPRTNGYSITGDVPRLSYEIADAMLAARAK